MRFKVGQRVKIICSSNCFKDTGKIGIIMSIDFPSICVYVKNSDNNIHKCTDKYGNLITWCLLNKDIKAVGQMMFDFMYDDE
jgi:hypothetical protein